MVGLQEVVGVGLLLQKLRMYRLVARLLHQNIGQSHLVDVGEELGDMVVDGIGLIDKSQRGANQRTLEGRRTATDKGEAALHQCCMGIVDHLEPPDIPIEGEIRKMWRDYEQSLFVDFLAHLTKKGHKRGDLTPSTAGQKGHGTFGGGGGFEALDLVQQRMSNIVNIVTLGVESALEREDRKGVVHTAFYLFDATSPPSPGLGENVVKDLLVGVVLFDRFGQRKIETAAIDEEHLVRSGGEIYHLGFEPQEKRNLAKSVHEAHHREALQIYKGISQRSVEYPKKLGIDVW